MIPRALPIVAALTDRLWHLPYIYMTGQGKVCRTDRGLATPMGMSIFPNAVGHGG